MLPLLLLHLYMCLFLIRMPRKYKLLIPTISQHVIEHTIEIGYRFEKKRGRKRERAGMFVPYIWRWKNMDEPVFVYRPDEYSTLVCFIGLCARSAHIRCCAGVRLVLFISLLNSAQHFSISRPCVFFFTFSHSVHSNAKAFRVRNDLSDSMTLFIVPK